jgi:hypothetical protein
MKHNSMRQSSLADFFSTPKRKNGDEPVAGSLKKQKLIEEIEVLKK